VNHANAPKKSAHVRKNVGVCGRLVVLGLGVIGSDDSAKVQAQRPK